MKNDVLDDDPKLAILSSLTDEDMLMELRKRGRLFRVQSEQIAPEHDVSSGYPLSEQILNAFRHIGHEIGREVVAGMNIPGCKTESVKGDGISMSPYHTGRRYTGVLNFVVGPKP